MPSLKRAGGKRRQVEHFLKAGYVEILALLSTEYDPIFNLDLNPQFSCFLLKEPTILRMSSLSLMAPVDSEEGQ